MIRCRFVEQGMLRFYLIFLFLLLSGFTPPTMAQLKPDPRADFFIALNGDDKNPGTLQKPFATLSQARAAVRLLKQSKTQGNIKVLIRGGLYSIYETVVFGLEDTGNGNQQIIYAAYPGEEPVFSGAKQIKGWKKLTSYPEALPKSAQGKVWVAEVPNIKSSAWRFHTLFNVSKPISSNQLLPRAESNVFFPDKERGYSGGYDDMTFATKEDKKDFYFTKEAPIRNWPNLTDVEIKIAPWGPFIMNFLPLAKVDMTSYTAWTEIPATYPMRHIDWYGTPMKPEDLPLETMGNVWIQNAIDFLDEPEEWVLNTQEGKLYFWPPAGDPGNNIKAPVLQELIRVEGEIDIWGEDIPVKNIVFRGLTFAHGERDVWQEGDIGVQHDWEVVDKATALLRFRGSENCIVDECRFINTGGTGLRFDLYSEYNTVKRNLFAYLGQMAVLICGYGPGTKDVSNHNTIINNHIHHCGQLIWSSHAIMIWESGFNRIAHNLIHDVPRKAVSLAGVRRRFFRRDKREAYSRQYHKTVRWKEVGTDEGIARDYDYIVPFLHVRYNVVEYNECHHILMEGQDGSGINVTGAAEGNVVQRNLIYDITSTAPDAAIRLDGNIRGGLVRENIIYDCALPGVNFRDKNNWIVNNVFVNVSYNRIPEEQGVFMFGSEGTGRVTRNICVDTGKKIDFLNDLRGAKLSQYSSDYNCFYYMDDPIASESFIKRLRSEGSDEHSISKDPLFVDLEKRNLRLNPNSPMLKLGFKPIDTERIGLTKDFPERYR
jgi:hypothetical protein